MYTVMQNGQSIAVFDTAQEARDYIQSMIDQGQTGFYVVVQVLDSS